jgi:hypothetical protein
MSLVTYSNFGGVFSCEPVMLLSVALSFLEMLPFWLLSYTSRAFFGFRSTRRGRAGLAVVAIQTLELNNE